VLIHKSNFRSDFLERDFHRGDHNHSDHLGVNGKVSACVSSLPITKLRSLSYIETHSSRPSIYKDSSKMFCQFEPIHFGVAEPACLLSKSELLTCLPTWEIAHETPSWLRQELESFV